MAKFLKGALAATAMLMTFGADANAEGPKCTTVNTAASLGAKPVAQLCLYSGPAQGIGADDSLSAYYGRLVATTNTSTTRLNANKEGLADFLASLFVKKEFTAEISMEITVYGRDGKVVLPARPLFVIQRKKGAGTQVAAETVALSNNSVSPYFSLAPAGSGADVRFKIAITDDTTFNVTDILTDALSTASALGAQGWVISTFSKAAVADAVAKMQDHISKYFSSAQTIGTTGSLSFDPYGARTLRYVSNLTSSQDQNGLFDISISMVGRASLITDKFDSTAQHVRPKVANPADAPTAGTWATNIQIANGKSLGSAITIDGIPRKLTGLDGPQATGPTPAQIVQSTCTDLNNALRDAKYFSLNETDADLILYDQLSYADVFKTFSPSEVRCYGAMLPAWQAKYGIVVPPPSPLVHLNYNGDMEPRLNSVAKAWRNGVPEDRKELLEYNVDSEVRVTVDNAALPAIWNVLGGDGPTRSGTVGAAALSSRQIACFGHYSQIDKTDQASALGRFASDDTVYFFQIGFHNEGEWNHRQGPLINALTIRRAMGTDHTDKLECKGSA